MKFKESINEITKLSEYDWLFSTFSVMIRGNS